MRASLDDTLARRPPMRQDKLDLVRGLSLPETSEPTPASYHGKLFIGLLALALLATVGLAYRGDWLSSYRLAELWPQAKPEPRTATPVVQPMTAPAASTALDASGFVVARRQATVSADLTGRVAEIGVVEGDHVREGQALAQIDTRIPEAQVRYARAQLKAAQDQVAVIQAQIEAARNTLERKEALAKRQFASVADVDQAQSAYGQLTANLDVAISNVEVARQQLAIQEEQLEITRIRAPFDGVVTEVSAHVGEIVSPVSAGGGFTRTGICTIVDLDSLEGEIQVNEQYLARLAPGQEVDLKSPAYPDLAVKGVVKTIMPNVDRSTAAVKVIVRFLDKDPRLVPGMRIDVTFKEHATG